MVVPRLNLARELLLQYMLLQHQKIRSSPRKFYMILFHFDLEIDLPNKDRKIRAGMSVEATINAGTLSAFAISPAHLSVGENGELTAKIAVDGKVVLVPVDVIRSGAELVFVSGLPDNAILLTVGQGFVEDGAVVIYKLASTS